MHRTIRAARVALAAFVAVQVAAGTARAATAPLQLSWADLIPSAERGKQRVVTGFVEHDEIGGARPRGPTLTLNDLVPDAGPGGAEVRTDLDGKEVRILGYLVPMALSGTKVTEFLLVPFIGACVHVPPPPANQVVFVAAEKGFAFAGLFQAIAVTGTISAVPFSTDLAEVGYQIKASDIQAVK
ncbi:MAG: DUF3299 domain-containing protein [Bauldia sp.]